MVCEAVKTESPGQVAQLVEHLTENQGVGGSIPSLATIQIKKLRAARKLPVSALCACSVPNLKVKIYCPHGAASYVMLSE